jgi:lysophospholipase L1-like esterase
MKQKKIFPFIMIVCSYFINSCEAQDTIHYDLKKSYGFEKLNQDTLSHQEKLNALFEQLYLQKREHHQTINILHIGDSHLQADFMTALIRTSIQNDFGNAGRGLIIPYKVARTNEPYNYATSSKNYWTAKRCVFPDQPMPIGIGGVTISNDTSGASFTVKTNNALGLNYAFNKITLFYQKDSTSYDFDISDTAGASLGLVAAASIDQFANQNIVPLPAYYNKINISSKQSSSIQNHATVFGLSLENGNSGVLYHTVGVNGAKYCNYSQAIYFSEQTKSLSPNLIILSLGTNEAFDSKMNEDTFYKQIEELYVQLKQQNPDAAFIITTPAASYLPRYKYNPRIITAAKTIIRFANDNGISCWDLQGITGGASNWKNYKLMQGDGVHYTRSGYELQGSLFYYAFINAYNSYVGNRLP